MRSFIESDLVDIAIALLAPFLFFGVTAGIFGAAYNTYESTWMGIVAAAATILSGLSFLASVVLIVVDTVKGLHW